MAAKRAVTTALLISWALVCVYLAIITPFRYNISRMFMPFADTNSQQISILADCILLLAAGALGDWTNCTLAGALQGAGRQYTGMKIYAVSHWCIGTALLWLYAFHLGFGVRGIWAALAVVSNVQCLLMGVRSGLKVHCPVLVLFEHGFRVFFTS
jgi:Na+-driven multidrug efflux pump